MIVGLLCGMLFAIPLVLLVGAMILRSAVSLTNRVVGAGESRRYEDEDDDDYFALPPPSSSEEAVPTPSIGKGMVIVLLIAIAHVIVGFVIRLPVGAGGMNVNGNPFQGTGLLVQLISLPIGFVISAAILSGMLPTRFARGCLVTLFEFLIILAIVAVFSVPMLVLGGAGR